MKTRPRSMVALLVLWARLLFGRRFERGKRWVRHAFWLWALICAMLGWGRHFEHLSTRPPLINPNWLVAAWWIDPANATGCASDKNSGTSATCGAAGSGIGPLLTWAELDYGRWGCVGSPVDCPILAQNTAITVLSTQPSFGVADPAIFRPLVKSAAQVTLVGVLNATTQVSSGTITVSSTKNRATHTELKLSTPVMTSGNLMVVTGAHAALGIVCGAPDIMCQPMTGTQSNGALPVEIDTWTTGDPYTEYAQAGFNIVAVSLDVDKTASATPLAISQLHWLNSGSSADGVDLEGPMVVSDSEIDRIVTSTRMSSPGVRFIDDFFNGGAVLTGPSPSSNTLHIILTPNSPATTLLPSIFGGNSNGGASISVFQLTNVWIDFDTRIMDNTIASFEGTDFYGCVNNVTGMRAINAFMIPTTAGACATNAIIWNTGRVLAEGRTRWSNTGATATNTYLSGILTLNARNSTGCSHTFGAADVVNCTVTVNVANLDTVDGGLLELPGGAAFTGSL